MAFFQGLAQHGPLAVLTLTNALGHVDANRHAAFQIELRVQPDLRLQFGRPRILHPGLDEHGQALQECAVNQGQRMLDAL